MSIIAKASTVGNNIKTIDFNGQPLITIEQDGIHYTAVKPICENIGLNWDAQRKRISRDDVLSEGAVIMTAPSKGGNQDMLCLPIEYLNGWLFGVDAKRVNPEIKDALIQYKKECYTVLHDYWHTGQAIHPRTTGDMPSTLQDRRGLVKAIKIAQASMGIDTCDAFNLVLHRFNISNIDDLPISQVGEATEYIHRMMLNTISEPYRNREHTETIFGSATPIIKNNERTTKFIGEIGVDGRMTMREMASDEFVTTIDKLPDILHASEMSQTDLIAISRLGVKVNQILLIHCGYIYPEVARLSGDNYESV